MYSTTLLIILLFFTITLSSAFVTTHNTARSSSENFNVRDILGPPTELLRLVEGFLEIKGEVASRLYRLLDNNADLVRSTYSVIVNNAATLHYISLTGVQLLRSFLEFVIQWLNDWEVDV